MSNSETKTLGMPARSEKMEDLSFKSKKEAIEFLKKTNGLSESRNGDYFYQSGNYNMSNGEYDLPSYRPYLYKDMWWIYITYFYYFGTPNPQLDGRVDPETFFNRFP